MDLIIYFLTILMTLVGIGCGIALAYIAKEELKAGKKAFIILQILLAISIFVFIFLDYHKLFILTSLMFLFGFPSGTLIIYEKFETKRINHRTCIIYSAVYVSFIIILSILQLI